MEEHEAIVKNRSAALRAAFPATVPVMTGYLCLGAAFGILLRTAGYGIGWSITMSMICYCGSMQFVAVTLLTTAFDPVQAFLLSVMVNARHMFYGLSLLDKYKGLGKVRAFLIYVLCDETFSLVSTLEPPEGVARRDFYFWISLLDYLYWITGTALGGLLGSFLTFVGLITFSPLTKVVLGTCSTLRIATRSSGYNVPGRYTFSERGNFILGFITDCCCFIH